MSSGFVWFAVRNKDVDYIDLSKRLAETIKKHNKENNVCIITDKKVEHKFFDKVVVLREDLSERETWKLSNECQVFNLTPFTHTIKLEADMVVNDNIDWWWYFLNQHDLIFSRDCFDYKGDTVKDTANRQLWQDNKLPNVYNGLTYFRKSILAKKFYALCTFITMNWKYVAEEILVNCHDKQPTTDVVYSLALKILDPWETTRIEYDWFKFFHNKRSVNSLPSSYDNDTFINPVRCADKYLFGGHSLPITHYRNKKLLGEIDARLF